MKALRLGLGIVVLALAAWLGVALLSAPPAPAAAPRAFTTSQACQECHAEVYAEWESSWHAKAWSDEDVRALSNDFQNTDCIDCHAPRPVFETGVGERVLPRSSRRNEGVDCISCHQLPDGRMAGTIERPDVACRPTQVRELSKAEHCAGCHDQHDTVKQWRATPFAENGVSCVDCHMPYRDGDPNRGRSHVCIGGHDLELVRSAVELRGHRSGEGWAVEVENVGAGHHFPTDERSRAADVFWRPLPEGAEAGPGAWRHLYRFRSPYRYETDVPTTLLPYGETQRLSLTEEDARGAVEVALFYKLTPYYEDPAAPDPEREARLVQRVVLRP